MSCLLDCAESEVKVSSNVTDIGGSVIVGTMIVDGTYYRTIWLGELRSAAFSGMPQAS
jgi:hypothetical protein